MKNQRMVTSKDSMKIRGKRLARKRIVYIPAG
jgi:hypothetical protein